MAPKASGYSILSESRVVDTASRVNMKGIILGVVIALTAPALMSEPAPHGPQRVISDWTHRHVLYPDAKDSSAMARIRSKSSLDAQLVSPASRDLVARPSSRPRQGKQSEPKRLERALSGFSFALRF